MSIFINIKQNLNDKCSYFVKFCTSRSSEYTINISSSLEIDKTSRDMSSLSIDDILDDVSKKELLKIVKNQVKSKDVEFHIDRASKEGENFMGEVYRIRFKILDEHAQNEPTSLIFKTIPPNCIPAKKVQLRKMFLQETLLYKEVLPFFNDIQLSKGIIPTDTGFNEYPKCYGTICDEQFQSIFLEDLKLRQFAVIDIRNESLTFDHMSLLMNAIGKFHALSFALKDQHPNKFNELKSKLHELYWKAHDPTSVVKVNMFWDRIIACLEEEKRFDLIDKLKQVIGGDLGTLVKKLISGSSAEPYSVICHGDLTTFNSMFRKDEHGKPIEIQILDWQCCRYASPVIELVLYLFGSTTKQLRDKYYEDFLKIYHNSLSELLSRLGSDPQKLFPYEVLLEQFHAFGIYAAIINSHLFAMIYADRRTVPGAKGFNDEEFKNLFLISKEFKKEYNKIVTDMLDDMHRYGCF